MRTNPEPSVNFLFAMPAHFRGMVDGREVILEFHQVGNFVKVSAVDPQTLTEVSIVGDPAASEASLRRAAIKKLDFVLERKARQTAGRRGA